MIASQSPVQQREILLDHACLEQQGPDLARGAMNAQAPRLAEHAHLGAVAQVGEQSTAQVHALADVEGQVGGIAVEDVDARTLRHGFDLFAQVIGIAVGNAGTAWSPDW